MTESGYNSEFKGSMGTVRALIELLILMVSLQALRELMERLGHCFVLQGLFENKMVTMGAMIILWLLMIGYIKVRKIKLSVFPMPFTKTYIIITIIAAALLVSTPSNYLIGFTAIMELIYGSIVTPVFEETIFRGYAWERLKLVPKGEIWIYVTTSLLFMFWHLGYMIPNIIDGNWPAVIMKLAAGGVYGFILGFVRLKSGNCYLPIVVHGIMNLFMI